jgi:hypothetical protein
VIFVETVRTMKKYIGLVERPVDSTIGKDAEIFPELNTL